MNRLKEHSLLSYLIACGLFCAACTPQDPAGDTDTTTTATATTTTTTTGTGTSGGDESGTTTDTSETTGTTAATATTATTATTGGACDGLIPDPSECQQCAMDVCCTELSACLDETECATCLVDANADPDVCGANAALDALNTCSLTSCTACNIQTPGEAFCDAPDATPSAGACGEPSDVSGVCNPITNEGCAADEACDVSPDGFVCYEDGNTHTLCEDCGAAGDGVFCVGGLTCIGQCAKFCCDDGDCGDGTCQTGSFTFNPDVGYCIIPE